MDAKPPIIQEARKRDGAMISHDCGVISHSHLDSTVCRIIKHNLSLDASAAVLHRPPMTMGQRIKVARESKGLSQGELGDMVGKGQTTVSSWEKDRTVPKSEYVLRIAEALRIPPSDIETELYTAPTYQPKFRELPVISWVSAGSLREPDDVPSVAKHRGKTVFVPDLNGGDYFATEVKGDSMDRLSPEGSVIIVNASDRDPRPGRCYLFSLRGETTFKRYQSEPVTRLEPVSTNPANQTIYPPRDRDWVVIGRVVRSILDID